MRDHSVTLRIAWGETDAAGIVFYPNYFRWFDRGTHELFRSVGLPLAILEKREGVIVPILSVSAEFHAPLRYDDRYTLKSIFDDIGEKTFKVRHWVTLRNGKPPVAEGLEVRGWAVKGQGKTHLSPIPDRFLRKLK